MTGLEVPLLTITDFDSDEIKINDRKIVLISGRIHPGEANGSWVAHGLIEFLLSGSP